MHGYGRGRAEARCGAGAWWASRTGIAPGRVQRGDPRGGVLDFLVSLGRVGGPMVPGVEAADHGVRLAPGGTRARGWRTSAGRGGPRREVRGALRGWRPVGVGDRNRPWPRATRRSQEVGSWISWFRWAASGVPWSLAWRRPVTVFGAPVGARARGWRTSAGPRWSREGGPGRGAGAARWERPRNALNIPSTAGPAAYCIATGAGLIMPPMALLRFSTSARVFLRSGTPSTILPMKGLMVWTPCTERSRSRALVTWPSEVR